MPALNYLSPDRDTVRYQEIPGEQYMNARQKAYLRHVLEEEKRYWTQRQDNIIVELMKKKDEQLSSDLADVTNREIELRSTVRGREYRLLKKIDKALQRLNHANGCYGFCDTCKAPIGMARLEVRPTANLCFDCKTLAEIRENQAG